MVRAQLGNSLVAAFVSEEQRSSTIQQDERLDCFAGANDRGLTSTLDPVPGLDNLDIAAGHRSPRVFQLAVKFIF
jgi:hypothetical protein